MNFHVKIIKRIAFGILLLASIISLAGCAYLQPAPITEPTITYIASGDGASLATHSPIFLIEDSTKSYNLIGTPTAELNADDKERVYVNSSFTYDIYSEE